MPDKITLDDALTQSAPKGITFEEALATRESAAVPIGREAPESRVDFFRRTGKWPQEADYVVRDGELMLAPKVLPPEGSHFGATLKADLVEDEEHKLQLISESLFPNDPKGRSRVGVVDGRPVYVDDEGNLREVSGAGARFGAAAIANSPEIVLGTAGSLTASPVLGGTAGAVAGRSLKRAAAGLFLDEPQTIEGNLKDIATEGALAAVAGGAGKIVGKVADRGRIVSFAPSNIRTAEQARDYIKTTTGVDVDLAQASGNRKLIAIRNYAARYPGKSAEMIQAADEAAQGQFDTATNRVLDIVARATPEETAYAHGVNAAQMVIKAARERVYKDVAPLYEAAYRAAPKVTDQKVLKLLELPYFDQAFKAGQRIAKLEGHALAKSAPPDLRSLDYTKRALDDRIESLIDAGKRQEARALEKSRDEFVRLLDETSGAPWKLARKRYGELINEQVTPLEEGAVGLLAKIERPRVASRAARVLTDRNMSPTEIRWTRDTISSVDPGAWNGLVRQYIGRTWSDALKESQTGTVTNAAGKLRQALIGTPRDKQRMEAMLPPAAVRAFDDLMNAAESLSRTPIRGSDTAFNQEIASQLKGRAAIAFRWLTQPRASIIGAAEQRALDQGVEAITEAILDPAKRGQLRQVVRMSDGTRKAIVLGSILSEQVGTRAVASDTDQLPAELEPAALP